MPLFGLPNPLDLVGVNPDATMSGLLDDFTGVTSAREANAANSANAQKQMDFQERMSNTAYQRSMADMKAAGLNPMLAAKNGGASTPTGASPDIKAVPSAIGSIANTALAAYTGITNSQKAIADAGEADSRAALNQVSIANVAADTQNKAFSGKNIEASTKRTEADTAAIRADLKKRENNAKIQDSIGKVIDALKPGVDSVVGRSASSAVAAKRSMDGVNAYTRPAVDSMVGDNRYIKQFRGR